MPRHYGRRRSMGPRQVIQSFKKVLNFAPASTGAGSKNVVLSIGQDSVAAGQTSATDNGVPTGAIIKYFEIQLAYSQIVGGSVFVHYSIQQLRSGQSAILSNVVGGSPQRNQVFLQGMASIGINQNWNRSIKFKIPRKFQRVREGDLWLIEITNSNTLVMAEQVIYKFYR